MLWCHGAQNIGLSNHRFKSALTHAHRIITMHARPRQTDGQTEEHHGIARQFVLTNALRAKN